MKITTIIRSALFTAVCLLASKLTSSADPLIGDPIAVPNSSFESVTNPSANFYTDQEPYPYNPLPYTQVFTDWENTSHQGGLLIGPVSTAGDTGTFQGSQAALTYTGAYFTSLNPVTTIAAGKEYFLTFAISDPSGAGSTTLQLLATTQGANTNLYYDATYPSGITDPYPLITTLGTLATADPNTVTGGSTAAGEFKDYTVRFNTFGTLAENPNVAFVGDSLSIGVNLGANASMDNVRLSVVPEPSTWALMLAGVAGLFVMGRRKLKV